MEQDSRWCRFMSRISRGSTLKLVTREALRGSEQASLLRRRCEGLFPSEQFQSFSEIRYSRAQDLPRVAERDWSEGSGQNLAVGGKPVANDNILISEHISAFPLSGGQYLADWPDLGSPRPPRGSLSETVATSCNEVFSKSSSKPFRAGTFGANTYTVG